MCSTEKITSHAATGCSRTFFISSNIFFNITWTSIPRYSGRPDSFNIFSRFLYAFSVEYPSDRVPKHSYLHRYSSEAPLNIPRVSAQHAVRDPTHFLPSAKNILKKGLSRQKRRLQLTFFPKRPSLRKVYRRSVTRKPRRVFSTRFFPR